MSLWLRHNPDPHIVQSHVSLARGETTRCGRSVEFCSSHVSFPQATQLHVFSRPSLLRSSASFMFYVVGPARLDRRFDESSSSERRNGLRSVKECCCANHRSSREVNE